MSDSQARARIIGTGMFLPSIVMTNDDIAELCDTNDEWIQKRTGIKQRHFAEEGLGASDLGTPAAKMALEESGLSPEDLDCIICATVTPDQISPSTSHLMQANLGATNAAGFDINAACSGFVYALSTANAFIGSGMYKNILVVGAETTSRILNWDYRATAILFADGAGAVVLSADTDGYGVLTSHLGCDGTGGDILNMPQGGWRHRLTPKFLEENPMVIGMNGPELFKRAVRIFCSEIELTLKNADVTMDDVTLFVPHQANARITDAVAERVGVPEDKVFMNIDHTGNTVAASIPMALHEAKEKGLIKKGDLILIAAFGAGLTWASALIRW